MAAAFLALWLAGPAWAAGKVFECRAADGRTRLTNTACRPDEAVAMERALPARAPAPAIAPLAAAPAAPEPPAAGSGLSWPLSCAPRGDCRVINLPQFSPSQKTALCRPNSLSIHEGTDVAVSEAMAERGVDVLAAADGTVLWVFDGKFDRCPDAAHPDCRVPAAPKPGSREGTTVCTPLGPYCKAGVGQCYWCFAGGNVVVIRHRLPGVFATRYDHFKTGSIAVRPGQAVKKGAVLGQVGSAGNSSGPHLHFEVWGSTFYDPVDPWAGRCSPPGRKPLWAAQPELR